MTRDEYLKRLAAIHNEVAELKRQFIRENATIEPPCYVTADGVRCFLGGYKVVQGILYPCLYRLNKSGEPTRLKFYCREKAVIIKE